MLEILYAALTSPKGVVVKTNDVERLRAKLYAARHEANDEALDALGLTPSPTSEDELWVVKKGKSGADD